MQDAEDSVRECAHKCCDYVQWYMVLYVVVVVVSVVARIACCDSLETVDISRIAALSVLWPLGVSVALTMLAFMSVFFVSTACLAFLASLSMALFNLAQTATNAWYADADKVLIC